MRVFVASTYREFARERAVVIETIREIGFQPVNMEDFGASSNAPIEVCVDAVGASEVMVILLGADYGTRIPDSEKSFTHVEIETAVQLGRPLLVYTHGLDSEWAAPGWPAPFRSLVASVLEMCTASTFTSSRKLRDLVARDLVRLAADRGPRQRPGLREAKAAISCRDFHGARRLLFEAIADDPADAYRMLSYVELLDRRQSDALANAISMLSRSAAAGDNRASAAIKALTACAPAWFDTR